jgi:hypothetical protein
LQKYFGRVQSASGINADAMHAFFDAKVAGVRSSTNDAPPPVFTDAPPECSLTDFLTLSIDDVIAAVRRLPDKQCASDPLPTSVLRELHRFWLNFSTGRGSKVLCRQFSNRLISRRF